MCALMLIFFLGIATSARVHDLNGYLVPNVNNNGGINNVELHRRNIDHRIHNDNQQFINPDLNRSGLYWFVGANRPRHENRHIGEHIQPDRQGFVDKSNEIVDENIDRIRTNTYSNIQTDRQFYVNIYTKNNFDNRRLGNTNHGLRRNTKGTDQNIQPTEQYVNKFQTNHIDIDVDIKQETVKTTPIQRSETSQAYDEVTEKSTPTTKKPFTNNQKSLDETGSTDSWIWGTSEETTKLDLDNRASFTGNECPTGQTKIAGQCVEKH